LTIGWILSQFDADPARAACAYRAFVKQGRGVSIWDDLRSGAFLGTDAFVEKLRPRLRERAGVTEIPREQRFPGRPSLAEVFAGVLDKATRDVQIYQAVRVHGYTLQEVADFLVLYYSTISAEAKRVAQARKHEE